MFFLFKFIIFLQVNLQGLLQFFLHDCSARMFFPPPADHNENQVQSCEVLSTAFSSTTAELSHQNQPS